MNVLMVCLGNICRSPLAEGILRHKVAQLGLNWSIDSAGTGDWHVGSHPDPRSIRVAKKYGIDITYQRARQFTPHDFDHFDHILVMDETNHRDVLALARHAEEQHKVHLIMSYSNPNTPSSVPDPYWDDDGFERVFQMLDQACKHFIDQIA